jgi:hypothetical protein
VALDDLPFLNTDLPFTFTDILFLFNYFLFIFANGSVISFAPDSKTAGRKTSAPATDGW